MQKIEDRTVRAFISSTFRDMHAERDTLVTIVFPELRERLDLLGLEFFDVDLRWGVPELGSDGERANPWPPWRTTTPPDGSGRDRSTSSCTVVLRSNAMPPK